jgi:peptidoglycan/xylan/chitin deacetylase (PgdA/CDA1 family)
MTKQIYSRFIRVIKLGISSGFFCLTHAQQAVGRLLGKQAGGFCVVLYYHSVPAAHRRLFSRQMDTLVRLATPVPAAHENSLDPSKRYAAVTFDDGFENFTDVALPELKSRRIPSTIFVIVDALSKAFGPVGRSERVMSVDQLSSLPRDLVTIGSHTLGHPFLPSLSQQEARHEITQSRTALETLLKRPIRLFSFPFGGFNKQLIDLCKESGYQRVFTTLPLPAPSGSEEFVTGRVRVDPTDWPLEFRLKLVGAYRWLPLAFALKRRLLDFEVVKWITGPRPADRSEGRESVIQEPSTM